MNKSILILGASGNFGSKIAKGLAKSNIPIIIAGRKEHPLVNLNNELNKLNPSLSTKIAIFDVNIELLQQLAILKPAVVINTCGPFQAADYSIASCCIDLSIHYIDLADGRDFVSGFHDALDNKAKENNCLVISGASTVPCLTSAVLECYKGEFASIESLIFGITIGQKTDRGLATIKAILSYAGKPLKTIPGSLKTVYGWQDIYQQTYPLLGKRWMANCDIPDLDLLPRYYGIQHIQFSAGIESSFLHLSLWIVSWIVRFGFPIDLKNHAEMLLKASHLFDCFGSGDGGMHMIFSGKDNKGNRKTIKWFIIAKDGCGPHIPTIPAIILSRNLIQGKMNQTGAVPCINLVSLEDYLAELSNYNIDVYSEVV